MGALRKWMPITAGTFIIGWLSIAGVPPFSGFWSKDEILLFAYEKSPVLWALGLITAVLTAFYMSRQVFLTFFGEARWDRPIEEAAPDLALERGLEVDGEEPDPDVERVYELEHRPHGIGPREEIHPHESTWTMTLPLVILAVAAATSEIIQLPISEATKRLEHWLLPVVETGEHHLTSSPSTKWALAIIATVGALVGIGAAYMTYIKRSRAEQPAEPAILRNAWYYDSTIAAFMGGPGRRAFDAVAWFDRTVIDGAVNGVATVVRGTGSGARRIQTGFVRAYAGVLTVGAIVLVAVMILRGVVL
jgi:NADH-quinone oxidoreductase subunit L